MPRLPLLPRYVRVGALLATLAVVGYFSLLDAPATTVPVGPWYDKQLHLGAYAAVTVAAVGATAEARSRPVRRVLGVVAFAVAFGVAIELAQWPLAGRYASLADVVANAVGTLLGTIAFRVEARLGYATDDPGRVSD